MRDLKILKVLSKKFDEINLVGGEPTISDDFVEIVNLASKYFKKVSMVTNGFVLSYNFDKLRGTIEKMSSIGVSIDFFNKQDNINIGRNRGENSLELNDYIKIRNKLNEMGVKFKINLMISKNNFQKNFEEEIKKINPDRLKILGVMEMDKKHKHNLGITKEEFNHFKNNNNFSFINNVVWENIGSMVDAYYMINGAGDIFINSGFSYKIIGNVLDDNFEKLFIEWEKHIDEQKYNFRYQ